MADFSSVALSHGHNRLQHIKYYGKPPELNGFNESSEILGGLVASLEEKREQQFIEHQSINQ